MTALPLSDRRRLDFEARAEDGFGAYHDLYAGGSTVSRLGPAFGASVTAHRFPRILMFDRRVAGAVHHRDAARVRRDGLDHFNIQVLGAGRMSAGVPGEERVMRPGDVAVFDATRPQRTAVEGAHYAVLSLPRGAVEAALPDARRLHGAVLPRAAAGWLGGLARSLLRHAPALTPERAARGGAMVADLLAAAAGAADAWRPDRDRGDDALALHRARGEAYIDARLHDPSLDAEEVAAALGLSRSALYRAFAPVGGVARRILVRRLARLHAALLRPDERRSAATLASAFGFASESHCSRAFKAAHGLPPGRFRAETRADMRAEARAGSSGPFMARDGGVRAGGLVDWLCDLR